MKNIRRFTTAEEARQAGVGSLPDALVAKNLGVTRQAVASWRKNLGIAPPHDPQRSFKLYAAFMAEHPEATFKEIEKHFGKSGATIRNWITRTGIHPKKSDKDTRQSKWTDAEILSALESCRSLREVATVLGTHETHVHHMLRTRNLRAVAARIPDGRKKK